MSSTAPLQPQRFRPPQFENSNPPTPRRILSPTRKAHMSSSEPRPVEVNGEKPSTAGKVDIPPPRTALDKIETAKRTAAFNAVAAHFKSEYKFVGIGSGSSIVYGVEAISHHLQNHPPPEHHTNWFVPTGWASHAVLEVCFDGADEVDEDLNCIKGGGACLFQEKLVALRSKKFVCIADYRKNQARLLTKWPSIPIEVAPIAYGSVIRELQALGSNDPQLREHSLVKTGPIQTDQSFYIIDAPFPHPLLTSADVANRDKGKGEGENGSWSVDALAQRIRAINGVLEVGLFHGLNGYETQKAGRTGAEKPVAVYFGMEDGSVKVLGDEGTKE
ncbi:ribose-5-phosphate isomerase rki1 [Oleoguttula sp. CCFEE 5521]